MVEPYSNIDFSKYMFDLSEQGEAQGSSFYADTLANKLIETKKVVAICDKFIFFTLNAANELSKFEYNKVIKSVINKINHVKKTQMIAQWYFENRDSRGFPSRLHVHGMLQNVPETFYPYESFCKYISKKFHEKIGRPKVKHSVSSDVQWAMDNHRVAAYCEKYQDKRHNFGLGVKLLLPRFK